MFNPNTFEKLPNIFSTAEPDNPFNNFNEWINYIHREANKRNYLVIAETTFETIV